MRWLRLAIVALAVGLFASVLVAWGCTLWTPLYESRSWSNAFGPPRQVPVEVPAAWVGPGQSASWRYLESLGPGLMYGQCTGGGNTLFIWRAGWPVEAMQCVATYDVMNAVETGGRGAVPAPRFLMAAKHGTSTWYQASGHYLPFEPLAAGLAVDTCVFAALWVLLRHGPIALRSNWRRGEGRCVECGYDRAGLKSVTCPECGDKTDSQTVATEAVRVRRRARLCGTAGLMAIIGLYLASLCWAVCWTMGNGMTSATLGSGSIVWQSVLDASQWQRPGFVLETPLAHQLWKPLAWWKPWNKGVVVPLWMFAGIIAAPAAWGWWAMVNAAARRRAGLCPWCGYDRRGIAPESVCPECGAATKVSLPSAPPSPPQS